MPARRGVPTVAAGLRGACPRCGRGRLFAGVLGLAPGCSECGLDYGRLDSRDGPAFFVIVVWSAVVIPLALWLDRALAPPLWVHVLVWAPAAVGGTVALTRPLKAWMAAQHYRHDPGDGR